jgi:hypothetical protein
MYETSLDCALGGATPEVVRRAANRTMRVSAGAPKLQLALAPPDGVAESRSAVSGPADGQPLMVRPSPEAVGRAAHPAAALGAPVGPLHENTV